MLKLKLQNFASGFARGSADAIFFFKFSRDRLLFGIGRLHVNGYAANLASGFRSLYLLCNSLLHSKHVQRVDAELHPTRIVIGAGPPATAHQDYLASKL